MLDFELEFMFTSCVNLALVLCANSLILTLIFILLNVNVN